VGGVWVVMSRDTYKLDMHHHGGPHVDRYNPQGSVVGRYRLDGTPIPHKGQMPPPVPAADRERFETETARAQRQER
jgi:hypothetical protein